jgi:hypothetical protein
MAFVVFSSYSAITPILGQIEARLIMNADDATIGRHFAMPVYYPSQPEKRTANIRKEIKAATLIDKLGYFLIKNRIEPSSTCCELTFSTCCEGGLNEE